MEEKEKEIIKDPIVEPIEEYNIINITSANDLAKYKILSEDPDFEPEKVRFQIKKQLIKEKVYETRTDKKRLEGEIINHRHQIMILLKSFYQAMEDFNNIGQEETLRTIDDLNLLTENDIYTREPLEKVMDVNEIILIDTFKNYMIEYLASLESNSDKYDE